MSIRSLINSASGVATKIPAEGVDFDGTNDYLSRSSDLTGNVDSKTFTFSCWVYIAKSGQQFIYSNDTRFTIQYVDTNTLNIQGRNSANTIILNASVSNLQLNGFYNILMSIDMSNTLNRSVYINDIPQTVTWTTYTNDIIEFTVATHFIGDRASGLAKLKGRLSNVFLDYTYRDLSIEANRRLFITADGKPTPTATLKALNPILYLPMKDAATAHINEGTGGNFTLNGTIATSERGANQDNCKASYFDGAADYLSRTSLTGVADGKQFTFSCNLNTTLSATGQIFHLRDSSLGDILKITVQYSSGLIRITIDAISSARATNLYAFCEYGHIVLSKTINLTISIDMSSTSKRFILVNNIPQVVTWSTYVNSNIDFSVSNPQTFIGINSGTSSYYKGSIGELYFDTKYIDIATNNPFWDSVANKPKPVRQVIRETGVTPLIAMPLDASNAGKNYGTGGDFTVNSGPYVGARGASEFWARSAKNGSTDNVTIYSNYLSNSSNNLGSVNTFSMVLSFAPALTSYTNYGYLFSISDVTNLNNYGISVAVSQTNQFRLQLNGGNTATTSLSSVFAVGVYKTVLISWSGTSIYMSIDGQASTTAYSTPVTFTTLIELMSRRGQKDFAGNIANTYFTTDYIDFSQEANRLKFIDGLGYPLDLKKQIDAGIIPKPLIYLPFDDPSNLGKNLGTGGDFVVNGSVTSGADVLG